LLRQTIENDAAPMTAATLWLSQHLISDGTHIHYEISEASDGGHDF
jgi:hypothetical protein